LQAKTLKLYWLNCNPTDRIFCINRPQGDLCNKAIVFPEDLSLSWLRLAQDLLSDEYRAAMSQLTGIVKWTPKTGQVETVA